MQRSPMLALLLTCSLLAPGARADGALAGFALSPLPQPAQGETVPLPDGSYLAFDGAVLEHWNATGSSFTTLLTLASPGTAGALAVDAAGARALVGVRESGELWVVNLAGPGGSSLVASLPGNRAAAFVGASTVYVSAGSPTIVVRFDLAAGGQVPVIGLAGQAGPLAADGQGGLLVSTLSAATPAPAASASVRSFSAPVLSAPPAPVYQEQNGLIVVQIESAPPTGQWKAESSVPGYTGTSYYRWNGPNLFNTPGQGILTYQINATTGGYYNWRIYNYHDNPQPDQENDCWVRMDGGPWVKAFSNDGPATVGVWNWSLRLEGATGSPAAFWQLTPGVHTLEISARSFGFHMDRMHFYKPGTPQALFIQQPDSPFAALGMGDSVELAGGLDGVAGLAADPASGLAFISEVNAATGANRVASVSGPGTPPGTLVTDSAGGPFGRLDFAAGGGPGIFFAFQPEGGGALVVQSAGTSGPERSALAPARPELDLAGPGTSGVGAVQVTVTGGAPGDLLVILAAPSAGTLAAEQPYFFGGLPLVWSALDPPAMVIVPTSALFDATGEARAEFYNVLGVIGALELQGILVRASAGVIGSSTSATL